MRAAVCAVHALEIEDGVHWCEVVRIFVRRATCSMQSLNQTI
jgi:hypothetical protein